MDEKGTYILVLFADITVQKKRRREEAIKQELKKLKHRTAKVRVYTANQMQVFTERLLALLAWLKGEYEQCLPYSSWAENRDLKLPKHFACDEERAKWISDIPERLRREQRYGVQTQ